MRRIRAILAIGLIAAGVAVFGGPAPADAGDFAMPTFTNRGGLSASRPAIASWSNGRLDVFIRGADQQLWHQYYQGGWSGWEPLGGQLSQGPAATAWSAGRLDIFIVGIDGQLWHKYYQGGWSAWEPLGGRLTSSVAVTDWGIGRLDIFARGIDGQLWHLVYANGWSAWQPLGGQLSGAPAAVAWGPGRIDVFARGVDGRLYQNYYSNQWSGWINQGVPVLDDPTVASWGVGRLDVFVRASDNRVYHRRWENGWDGFTVTAGTDLVASGPAAVSWGSGRVDLVAVRPGGSIGSTAGVYSAPPPPPPSSFPTAATTGVPAGVTLTPSGSMRITQAGAVIDARDISGTVEVAANNVTIQRSRIRASAYAVVRINNGITGTVIQDTEIDGLGSTGNAGAVNGLATLRRVNLHHVENGFVPGSGSSIVDSYIHDLVAAGAPHYDGVQIDGNRSNIVVQHNTITVPNQTSAVMVDNYYGPISNITIDGNRLSGGSYTVYSDGGFNNGSITGVRITNNRFGWNSYGRVLVRNNTLAASSGNVDDATGQPVSIPSSG